MIVSLVIDTNTNTVIDTNPNLLGINPIPVGNSLTVNPQGIAYDNATERMYVANNAEGIVSVIDTNTNMVVGTPISVGSSPTLLTYDPVNERMYVTNFFDNTVSVIDTTSNTVIATILVGTIPKWYNL